MSGEAHTLILLGRATGFLSLAALLAAAAIRLARPASPVVQQWLWLLVLVQGLVFFQLSVVIPWYEAPQPLASRQPAAREEPVSPAPSPPRLSHSATVSKPAEPNAKQPTISAALRSSPAAAHASAGAWIEHWPRLLLLAWLAGMLLVVLHACRAYLQISRWIVHSEDPEEAWDVQWRRLLAQRRITRPLPLRVTETLGPALCLMGGGYRLVVPRALWAGLSAAQRRTILLHELAHWQRGDLGKLLLARFLTLPHWFNPLAWWALRKFQECTEWICDDIAASSQEPDRLEYARALVSIGAERPSRALYVTSVQGGRLYHRIRRLLASSVKRDALMKRVLVFVPVIGLLLAGFLRVELVARSQAEEKPAAAASAAVSAEKSAPESKTTAPVSGNFTGTFDIGAGNGAGATNVYAGTLIVQTSPPTPPLPLSAAGKVVDAAGKPVAGATVYVRQKPSDFAEHDPSSASPSDILAQQQTNAQGEFRFEKIPPQPIPPEPHYQPKQPEPWDVVVTAPGWAIAWQHIDTAQPAAPLTIKLQPEAKITGRVTDEKGQPLQGADVSVGFISPLGAELFDVTPVPEFLDFNRAGVALRATSDSQGRVTLGGLPPQRRLWLDLTHPRRHAGWLLAATTDQPQPELNGLVETPRGDVQAGLVPVYAGSFTAVLKPTKRIVGTVVDAATGNPVAGAHVYVLNSSYSLSEWSPRRRELVAASDQAGRFVFPDMPKAFYRVIAYRPHGSPYLGRLKNISLPADQAEVAVRIELARGEPLAGRVVSKKDGKGIPKAQVTYLSKEGRDWDWSKLPDGSLVPSTTETDAEGRFQLPVPPGKGAVEVREASNAIYWTSTNTSTINYDVTTVEQPAPSEAGTSPEAGSTLANTLVVQPAPSEAATTTAAAAAPPARPAENIQQVDVVAGQPHPELIFSLTPPASGDYSGGGTANYSGGTVISGGTLSLSARNVTIDYSSNESETDRQTAPTVTIVGAGAAANGTISTTATISGSGSVSIAGQPASRAPRKLHPPIEGKVFDPEGRPVADAVVGLRPWFESEIVIHKDSGTTMSTSVDEKLLAKRFAHTDASGRFVLRDVAVEEWDWGAVQAVHKQRQLIGLVPMSEDPQAGMAAQPLDIWLSPTGSVSGIAQKDGKPCAGVHICIQESPLEVVFAPPDKTGQNPYEGRYDISMYAPARFEDSTQTDAQGRFHFALVPAHKEFAVRVYPRDLVAQQNVYKVRVKAGENVELAPFVFIPTNESVSGIVVDPAGKPVAGVDLVAWTGPNSITDDLISTASRKPTGADGHFTITGLPKMPVVLHAGFWEPDGKRGRQWSECGVRVRVEPGQKDVRIEVPRQPPHGKQ